MCVGLWEPEYVSDSMSVLNEYSNTTVRRWICYEFQFTIFRSLTMSLTIMFTCVKALRSLMVGHNVRNQSSLPLLTPRLRLARRGRERARDFIGWNATVDQWVELVNSVVWSYEVRGDPIVDDSDRKTYLIGTYHHVKIFDNIFFNRNPVHEHNHTRLCDYYCSKIRLSNISTGM